MPSHSAEVIKLPSFDQLLSSIEAKTVMPFLTLSARTSVEQPGTQSVKNLLAQVKEPADRHIGIRQLLHTPSTTLPSSKITMPFTHRKQTSTTSSIPGDWSIPLDQDHKPHALTPSVQLPSTHSIPLHSAVLHASTSSCDLTLAGKARKRSAQACYRCKVMKIRCRIQDDQNCITCTRQGLQCTFAQPSSGLRRTRKGRGAPSRFDTSSNDSRSTVDYSPGCFGSVTSFLEYHRMSQQSQQ